MKHYLRSPHRRAALACALSTLFVPCAYAQVSLTTLGTPYTQNFDTLAATGTVVWANNSTLAGWYHARTGTGSNLVANDGASNAGNLYSYGTGSASERALGSVGSGNAAVGSLFWGVRLKNNTGSTITSLDIAYNGEQWRNGGATAHTVAFSYLAGNPVAGTLTEFQNAGTAVTTLDFTSPITGGTAAALNGNLAANRSTRTATITGLNIANGSEIMLRWSDPDHGGADHGLAIDDVSITPLGSGPQPLALSINDASVNEGNSGAATLSFTVSLSQPAPAGGVTFDIATADGTATAPSDYIARALTAQTIPAGSSTYTFDVTVNGDADGDGEPDETLQAIVTNVTGAALGDGQGQGTIVNDDALAMLKIHDVQGNGAATPIGAGVSVTVEGVVVANYQGTGKLSGFFLQEETADADADPATSEGVFVYCASCPTAVVEGQRVRVTGAVSEFFSMTQINATDAGSVVVADAGNHLAEVTPANVSLPIAGSVDAYYEAREGMLVRFAEPLFVSEYFELARYGQIELYQGDRPRQYTEDNVPGASGNNAYLETISRRKVILDDENN
ncbi:MAG TPA: hypothetical protein VM555_10605, partial [Tahibacter sp.]|nr:hypothetical protein [Tahibacter sp.]